MFQAWRWKIRQAEAACVSGRLDEALQILLDGDLRSYQPAQRIVDELTQAFLARITQRIDAGEIEQGWSDWEAAALLAGPKGIVGTARERLIGAELWIAESQ